MAMKAKQYLNQIRQLEKKCEILQDAIDDICVSIEAVDVSIRSSWPDGQPHGTGRTDPVGSKAARDVDSQIMERRLELKRKLLDYKLELSRRQTEYSEARQDAIRILDKVEDGILHDLLYRRYIKGESFERIAVEIGYSWRHTIRLHGDALQKVDAILLSEKK